MIEMVFHWQEFNQNCYDKILLLLIKNRYHFYGLIL